MWISAGRRQEAGDRRQTHPIVAQQRGEVGRLERMHGVHELCAVERVGGGEDAAREQAQLHEARHGLVLGGLGGARREPAAALACQPRPHPRHVLRLTTTLLLHIHQCVHIHENSNLIDYSADTHSICFSALKVFIVCNCLGAINVALKTFTK